MGRGAGKGGAQLGKPVKGRSKEKAADPKAKVKDNIADKQLGDDIKMLEEYEKMNKLAEAQKIRLKKLQQQEAYNTKINKKLLLNIHRKFMRADKVDQLRKEIEILAQNHEREVDRKDAVIQMLTRDLDDAEEQFQTAQRTHMEKLTKFTGLHEEKIGNLISELERDLKALKLEFYTERDRITSAHNGETKEMKGIINAVEAQENERIAEAKQAHETEREEIRNKNLEGINELRINLENKIEDLEKQFDEAHQTYVEHTDSRNKHFKELQAEDKKLSKIIDMRKRKIERMQANLAYWKKKIESNQKECQERNQFMREQKEAINKHCLTLKARMKKFRSNESKRLSELTMLSRNAMLNNEEKMKVAEQILQLAELGRRLETEREKVQPFYTSAIQEGSEEQAEVARLKNLLDDEAVNSEYKENKASAAAVNRDGQIVGEYGCLENFHKKFNKVLLDKLAIGEEKKRLQKENSDLRGILKQYLDGIAITEDVVDDSNPLLIVNGKVNLTDNRNVRRIGRPNHIMDANKTVNQTAKHVVMYSNSWYY